MRTQDDILKEMLAGIPGDLDKEPRSPIYTALAPVAAMLSEITFECDQVADSTMADTAAGVLLTKTCAEYGVNRIPASVAIRRGIFVPDSVMPGSRFGADGLGYVVTAPADRGGWQLRCEVTGIFGNSYFGAILPLDNLNPGLESAQLADVLVYGMDEESDASLRSRFYDEARFPEHGWNKKGYKKEIRKIAGVGDVAVFPTPGGQGGRVHCIIVDPYNKPASTTLINTVQQLLDPAPIGEGNGLVPPGHTVTITTVRELAIAVAAKVAVKSGFTLSTLKPLIEASIAEYLRQASFHDNIVRISRIEAAILMVDGVVDIGSVTINGSATNISLSTTWQNYQVPILGAVVLEVL